jgi:hypothetical protein
MEKYYLNVPRQYVVSLVCSLVVVFQIGGWETGNPGGHFVARRPRLRALGTATIFLQQ